MNSLKRSRLVESGMCKINIGCEFVQKKKMYVKKKTILYVLFIYFYIIYTG